MTNSDYSDGHLANLTDHLKQSVGKPYNATDLILKTNVLSNKAEIFHDFMSHYNTKETQMLSKNI